MRASDETKAADTRPRPRYLPFGSSGFFISKLEEALEVADGEPLPFADLIQRLRTVWIDTDRQLVLERLEQMAPPDQQLSPGAVLTPPPRRLPESQQDQLMEVLTELVSKADDLPSRDRDRVDRAVARLSRLLSIERAWFLIEPWFGDRRAFRTSVVIRVLLHYGVPPTLAAEVVEQYRAALDRGVLDRGLLKLIGRNPHVAVLLNDDLTLKALTIPGRERWIGDYFFRDDDALYWRMRAIEALLIGGQVPRASIALAYPMPFIWAVGRQTHHECLPLLRKVLEQYHTDPECVWRCMRAFERVGDPSDVEYVRALAASIVETERTKQLPDVA
ncbi:MAG: hypothetical protein M3R02_13860 [Chloroflexota bacterium]|nr:hypothetical protein [Chloroflexota bacterium]